MTTIKIFFFSSRRRHTRCSRDWSSDVSSSDLTWSQSVDKHCQEQTVWCKDLDTHCRKQTARITELEFHSREQTTWSREIEKYNRDQNRVVLDLVGIVQKSTSGADGGSPASAATPGG